jgi:hypothetical protein
MAILPLPGALSTGREGAVNGQTRAEGVEAGCWSHGCVLVDAGDHSPAMWPWVQHKPAFI